MRTSARCCLRFQTSIEFMQSLKIGASTGEPVEVCGARADYGFWISIFSILGIAVMASNRTAQPLEKH